MTIRNLPFAAAVAAIVGTLSPSVFLAETATARAAPTSAVTPVNKIDHPAIVLARLPVHTAEGQLIGVVETIVTGSDGHALVVTVINRLNKTVGIQADKLGFDAGRRLLVANLTPAEVNALPHLT